MVEQQTEMSLDDVLSSIKQMVIDKDPPVLELTDMISSDGTIVKVKNGPDESSEEKTNLRDFLRQAQEKGKESSDLFVETQSRKQTKSENVSRSTEKASPNCIAVEEIVREVVAPLVQQWLDQNLVGIVREVVSVEIQKMMKQK